MDEALGSWLGRVAARYRVGVVKLIKEQELLLGATVAQAGWIALPRQEQDAIEQVAWLARVDAGDLLRIQTPDEWSASRTHFNDCSECLFLNRFDVTAPRWMLDGLNPEAKTCPVHGEPYWKVPASALRQCTNMDGVIRRLSPQRVRPSSWGWCAC